MAVAVLSLAGLLGNVSELAYALVLAVLPFAYYFALTFKFSVIAAADHNGRVAGLMAFSLAAGSGLGPFLFGALRAADAPVVMVMGLLIISGTLISLLIERQIAPEALPSGA